MFSMLTNAFTGAIVKGMVEAMREYRNQSLHERMQAEVLDGWVSKIKIAVEREMSKQGAPFKAYSAVEKAIDKVVKEEFDTDKI